MDELSPRRETDQNLPGSSEKIPAVSPANGTSPSGWEEHPGEENLPAVQALARDLPSDGLARSAGLTMDLFPDLPASDPPAGHCGAVERMFPHDDGPVADAELTEDREGSSEFAATIDREIVESIVRDINNPGFRQERLGDAGLGANIVRERIYRSPRDGDRDGR